MADYTYNCDKWNRGCETALYNSVLGDPVFSNESAEPITLEEAKSWGKIDQDADDDIITELIVAAREICEGYVCIGFVNRDIVVPINNSNGGFYLPYGPVISGPSAVDAQGNDKTVTYNVGQLQEPLGYSVVTYNAGYGVGLLPKRLKTALKAQVLFMEQNRGEGTETLSPIAKMFLEPMRRVV